MEVGLKLNADVKIKNATWHGGCRDMAVKSHVQGAKWEQKSHVKRVQVNLFHEVEQFYSSLYTHWGFPAAFNSSLKQHAVWVLPEGPDELFDQNWLVQLSGFESFSCK